MCAVKRRFEKVWRASTRSTSPLSHKTHVTGSEENGHEMSFEKMCTGPKNPI